MSGAARDWVSLHDRAKRPDRAALAAYWPPEALALFEDFAGQLSQVYGVHADPMVFTRTDGWTLRFGHAGVPLVGGIQVLADGFMVEGVAVRDAASLAEAMQKVEALYRAGYAGRLAAHQAAVRTRQSETVQRRRAREQAERAALEDQIDPVRFNQFVWAKKVSRQALKQLYTLDAAGRPDEALADEIGLTLYTRCRQGRDERVVWDAGKLPCHGCGEALPVHAGLMECACGRQYMARDWARAFRINNMPSGSAAPIFEEYLTRWERARTYAAKMRAIDWLVHAFHMNLVTGVKGRFVGINLIEGSKAQIGALILSLAYGGEEAREGRRASKRAPRKD